MDSEYISRSGGVKSGLALALEDRRLSERRERDTQLYRLAEGELFEKIRLVHNTHRPEAALPEESGFEVEFQKEEFSPVAE